MSSTPLTITCPKCGSTDCRESRWRSHQEKVDNPGQHPYRCLNCANRFVGRHSGSIAGRRSFLLLAGLAGLAVVALVAGVVVVLLEGRKSVPEAPSAGMPVGAAASTHIEAAARGDTEAQFRAGRAALLDTARGKEATLEALGWLKRASEGGHTGAMILLGKLYRNGVGITQNYDLASRWIAAAAEAGDPEGMVELGRLHRAGIGVPQDAVQAYVWFNRAAAALNMNGVQERDSIAIKLSPDELKRAQTLSLEHDTHVTPSAERNADDKATPD